MASHFVTLNPSYSLPDHTMNATTAPLILHTLEDGLFAIGAKNIVAGIRRNNEQPWAGMIPSWAYTYDARRSAFAIALDGGTMVYGARIDKADDGTQTVSGLVLLSTPSDMTTYAIWMLPAPATLFDMRQTENAR